jgi:hypothetical protein
MLRHHPPLALAGLLVGVIVGLVVAAPVFGTHGFGRRPDVAQDRARGLEVSRNWREIAPDPRAGSSASAAAELLAEFVEAGLLVAAQRIDADVVDPVEQAVELGFVGG